MILDYVSLAMLIVAVTAVFYGFIYIHDIPYQIAKKRNHPQVEAIHYGCWLSLFTLHAIWPIVFIWAVSNRDSARELTGGGDVDELRRQVDTLQRRVADLEAGGEGSAS